MLPSISKIRRDLSLAIDAQIAKAYATGYVAGRMSVSAPVATGDMKNADERAAEYVARNDPQKKEGQS